MFHSDARVYPLLTPFDPLCGSRAYRRAVRAANGRVRTKWNWYVCKSLVSLCMRAETLYAAFAKRAPSRIGSYISRLRPRPRLYSLVNKQTIAAEMNLRIQHRWSRAGSEYSNHELKLWMLEKVKSLSVARSCFRRLREMNYLKRAEYFKIGSLFSFFPFFASSRVDFCSRSVRMIDRERNVWMCLSGDA